MVKKILVSLAVTSALFATSAMACHSSKKVRTCSKKSEKNTSDKVISAVSKTGLSATQTKKIAQGIAEYEETIKQIKRMRIFPVDSFINEEFDEKRFIKEMSEKYIAGVAARAALYKYVFAILDKEQRKIFKREYSAPLINALIRSY